jgi:nicotinamidase-related amidase
MAHERTDLKAPVSDPYIEPAFASAALLTIDVQRDTLDGGSLEVAGTSAALERMRAVAQAFRAARRPIVHIVRLYLPDGSNVDLCRRSAVQAGQRYLAPGATGSQLAAELVPADSQPLDTELLLAGGVQSLSEHEVVIYKPRWGAFYRTPLDEQLRERKVSTLVFCGCNFPNCPRTSIYEASERDFRVVLVRDAVSGLYERGEHELERIGVALMGAAEVSAAVELGRAGSGKARPGRQSVVRRR